MDRLTLLIAGALLLSFLAGTAAPRWLRWTGQTRPARRVGAKSAQPGAYIKRFPAKPAVDSADQLRLVMAASFERRRLMSKDEARVFYRVEKAIKTANLPWRVMAQVNLGEILSSPDSRAFSAINSKRVDMLVITRSGDPLAAIEFQGAGHYLGTAAARDAVKKEALRRAGVRFIEVTPAHTADDISREVLRLAEQPILVSA